MMAGPVERRWGKQRRGDGTGAELPSRQAGGKVLSSRPLRVVNVHPRGRIAQLVEQLTLNQRVQGSSPCAPTNKIKEL